MIDFGLSDQYLAGYGARLKGQPFDNNETDDWKMGWLNENQALKFKVCLKRLLSKKRTLGNVDFNALKALIYKGF